MWIVVIIGIGVLTAVGQLAIQGFPADHILVLKTFLLHQFVVTHGIVAVGGFIINVITPEKTAAKLGWPGGLFQVKYGFSQLGLGVMGALSIWFQGNFWAATMVTLYVYGVSGLWTHRLEVVRKRRLEGRTDMVELGNMVLDVVYHGVLTWMSLQIPGVWSLG